MYQKLFMIFSIHPGKKKYFLTFPRVLETEEKDKGYLLKPRYLSASFSHLNVFKQRLITYFYMTDLPVW